MASQRGGGEKEEDENEDEGRGPKSKSVWVRSGYQKPRWCGTRPGEVNQFKTERGALAVEALEGGEREKAAQRG
jgi:hypothetical protein